MLLIYDIEILPARMQRFREMVEIWYDSIANWVKSFSLEEAGGDESQSYASSFVAMFLDHVKKVDVVEFICGTVLPQAQYLLADPNLEPEDLLKLPRISKEDTDWGCYFDLFTNARETVVGWYTGSATAMGSPKNPDPSGLIGRLLSYFPKTLVPIYAHLRWLVRATDPGSPQPNIRKVADCRSFFSRHRVYTIILETFLITIVGFNVEFKPDGSLKVLPKGTPEWVKLVRRQMGVKVFERVEYINKCLPIKQGCPRDIRFGYNDRTPMRCSNPTANCPATTGKFYLMPGTFLGVSEFLCVNCYRWQINPKNNAQHRPQHIIDRLTKNKAAESEGCYWCHDTFPTTGKDRKNFVPELEECLCQPCYITLWKEHNTLFPVRGLDYPSSHVFQCKGCNSLVALKWFFEAKYNGRLHCERCHFQTPYITTHKVGI
jgi:hypothetical protein